MGDELTRYQKDLIRMWDSLRTEVFKGVRTCAGVLCSKCPFDHATCSTDDGKIWYASGESRVNVTFPYVVPDKPERVYRNKEATK